MSQEMARNVGSWIGQWYPSMCFFVPLLLFFPVALLSSGGNVYLSILLSFGVAHYILFLVIFFFSKYSTRVEFFGEANTISVIVDTLEDTSRMFHFSLLSFGLSLLVSVAEYFIYGNVRWRNGLWQKFLSGYVLFSWGLLCSVLWALSRQ